ncbi:proteinase inhibitor I4 [Gracilaria domingensis]|nr:proteinase inhibitor I4 [Gracilaria domingensis]
MSLLDLAKATFQLRPGATREDVKPPPPSRLETSPDLGRALVEALMRRTNLPRTQTMRTNAQPPSSSQLLQSSINFSPSASIAARLLFPFVCVLTLLAVFSPSLPQSLSIGLPSAMRDATVPLAGDQISAVNNLGFQLLASLNEPDSLLSPYSIASALSLVSVGSAPSSQTRSEFEVLLASGASKPIAPVTTTDKSVTLHSASAAVLTSLVLPSYKDAIVSAGAELIANPSSAKPINDWISTATKGRISDLFTDLPSPLVAILINAIFFQASWTTAFDPAETRKLPFNQGEQVDMMRLMKEKFPYAECTLPDGGSVQIAQLPYGDGSLAATFVLPSKDGSLDEVIKLLGEQGETLWSSWTEKLTRRKLDLVALPRFKLKYGVKSVKGALKSFGLQKAFEVNVENPPFPLLTEDKEAHLSDVLHAATLEVTEEGTVASAASAAIVLTRAAPRPNPEFIANRPFLMAVRNTATNAVLFIARVDKPISP